MADAGVERRCLASGGHHNGTDRRDVLEPDPERAVSLPRAVAGPPLFGIAVLLFRWPRTHLPMRAALVRLPIVFCRLRVAVLRPRLTLFRRSVALFRLRVIPFRL